MRKNKDKQASAQLSLFDALDPQPSEPETGREDKDILVPESKPDVIVEEVKTEQTPIIPEPEQPMEEEPDNPLLTTEPVTPEDDLPDDLLSFEITGTVNRHEPEVLDNVPEEEILVPLISVVEEKIEDPEEQVMEVEVAKDFTDKFKDIDPAPSNRNGENEKQGVTTEDILSPMVIYFDGDEITSGEEDEITPDEEDKSYPATIPEDVTNDTEDQEVVEEIGEQEVSNETELYETEETISESEETTDEQELIVPLPSQKSTGKKILITGASGFIGGFLVQEALNRGYEVWAGIRPGSDRSRLEDTRIHFIQLIYDDQEILTGQFEEFREQYGAWDFVIHNAGITKTLDKKDFFAVNAENTYHFLEALNAADCKPEKFLLMSSLSSYGAGDEKGFTPIGLDDPQRPDTVYGLSKLEAEKYVRRQTYFPYIILRPTGVYGPGDKDYLVEMKSIQSGFDFTAGLTPQQITFIYVKDLATVAFLALENEQVINKHYFVADGDVYTDHSFARMLQRLLDVKKVFRARIPSGLVYMGCLFSEAFGKLTKQTMTLNTDKYKILKQRNWICDIRPLKEDLGFVPAYNLEKGLIETIDWYRKKGWLK